MTSDLCGYLVCKKCDVVGVWLRVMVVCFVVISKN